MRQRLGLADILIKNPEIIILDEPTLGIDPKGVREFMELIVRLSREEGLTVLLSSHQLHQVKQICDRVGIFVNGKLLAEGDIYSLSKKLFANSLFVIEAGVIRIPDNTIDKTSDKDATDWLNDILSHIDGIIAINKKKNIFHIESSRDSEKFIRDSR